jgi:hypothetical protein
VHAAGAGGSPLMSTEKELVASPAPPCHSSKPASMSIRGLRRQAQVAPFTENDVGEASLLVQVPWKPSETEPPAAIVAL